MTDLFDAILRATCDLETDPDSLPHPSMPNDLWMTDLDLYKEWVWLQRRHKCPECETLNQELRLKNHD